MSDIPTIETYKGIGIHDHQPRDRIERRVKPEIDAVLAIEDMYKLAEYSRDISRPPEARLLAGAMAEAFFDLAIAERRARPDLDIARLRAGYCCAGSNYWRSGTHYGSLLDHRSPPLGHGPQMEPREEPIPEAERVRVRT